MEANPKLTGLLGMARRAGKLSIGFDAATAAVKEGKSPFLLLASDVSPKTEKECRFAVQSCNAQIQPLPLDKAALAAAIGCHKPVGVAAVCEQGFANAILKALT